MLHAGEIRLRGEGEEILTGEVGLIKQRFQPLPIQANAGEADSRHTIIDEYFAGDDSFEPEPQHRQVLLWLLSLLSPRLADLLSCPPAE